MAKGGKRRRKEAEPQENDEVPQYLKVAAAVGAAAGVVYLVFRPSTARAQAVTLEAEPQHDHDFPLVARLSAYWPATVASELAEEGPNVDGRDNPLHTLDDYMNGLAPFVSVAADFKEFAYGERIRIRELEDAYGKPIDFRVVDALHADRSRVAKGSGTRRLDIRVASRRAGLANQVNSWVHYKRLDPPTGAVIAEVPNAD